MSLKKCHKLVTNLRALHQNSTHHPIHQNNSHHSIRHHSNHRSRKCQWDMFVQNPEFPSLPLISSFQDLGDKFSTFYPCESLWHLWFLWTSLWIFPCFLYSFPLPSLLDHDLPCFPFDALSVCDNYDLPSDESGNLLNTIMTLVLRNTWCRWQTGKVWVRHCRNLLNFDCSVLLVTTWSFWQFYGAWMVR